MCTRGNQVGNVFIKRLSHPGSHFKLLIGSSGVTVLEVLKDGGDVALRDAVSGHGGGGLGLEVSEISSNYNNSAVP